MDFKDLVNGKDPFGYPLTQYLWVISIACIGGLVKHINSVQRIRGGKLVIDITTSGFTGVLTFWFCESANIHGPVSAIMIATGGLMGNRAWKEFENFWRMKFGVPAVADTVVKPAVETKPAADEDAK